MLFYSVFLSMLKPQKMCLGCGSVVSEVVCCKKCSSGCYCSEECVEKHRREHEVLCGAIRSLEEIEVGKLYRELKRMETTGSPTKDKKIIDLIGDKPVVDVGLQGIPSKCLWDTGSQVSIINNKLVEKNWPGRRLHSVQEFLGNKKLGVSTANNTEMPIEGVVLLEVEVEGSASFTVPFLVTKENLTQTIIGSNIMKHLILNNKNSLPSLMKLLPSLPLEHTNLLISAVETELQQSDMIGEVKLSENLVIPANHMVRARGKTRVELGAEERDVLFAPAAQFLGEHELVIYEATERLKGGKSQFISVVVCNPTSQELYLKKGTILGNVSDINTVIQFPARDHSRREVLSNSVGVDYASDEEEEAEKLWEEQLDLSGLSEDEFREAKEMLLAEHEVFSKSKNDIGHVPDFQIPIDLTDNIPVSESYRSIPRPLYEDVKNHINNLIAHGWVRKSSSSYASPMVCARKKDGSLRLCIDFRRLNAKIVPFRQPIPRVQDILDGLKGQEWFSTLDMSQAYHQGEISEASRKFTAFSTPWSLLEWVRIPYGLSNAPPYFQQFINEMLGDLKDQICVAYLDDILIYGKTFKEHKRNLRTVLQCLKKKGIKLNLGKCNFFKKEVRYLGRLISKDGYRADPSNTEALDACLKPPRTVGKLRSLLGFLGYYRNFVMDFSRTMKPVYDLLKVEEDVKKDKRTLSKRVIDWLPEHQKIVEGVVACLKSPEVIAFPDYSLPFFIHCDASNTGLGGVLYQEQERLRVISYASRTLSPAEKNYNLHSGKLEFLALKWCITEKFKDYLHFGPRFTVFTDNNPLTYVLSTAKLNAAGLRWVAQLADYEFDIKYRPGKLNIDADFLSRHPVEEFEVRVTGENELISAEDVNIIFSEASKKDKQLSEILSLKCLAMDVVEPQEGSPRITREQLNKEQMVDAVISPIIQAMSENRAMDTNVSRDSKLLNKQRGKLLLENGVLFRKTINYKQIVLPKRLHSIVFKELHNNMGHLGRVWELARKRFYWPNMRRDIELYVQKQCRCVMSKKKNSPDRAPLVPITSSHPFELVSVDFCKLDECKGGYKFAMVVCDHFTRFTQVYATKNKKGRTAADVIFNKFILQYGWPERLHHDQGGEFENRCFERLHQLSGIKSSHTTPYHPEGDGQVERMNRTMLNMLKCLEEEQKGDWSNHLAKLAFAYNATTHKSTGYSPFFLLMGREPVLPVDWVFGLEIEKLDTGKKSYDKLVSDWKTSMQQALEIARRNAGKSGEYNKEYYDKRAKGVPLAVGDKVLCRNREKGGTGKLRSHWEKVIYTVIKMDPDIPVITVQEKKGGKQKRIHRNNVTKCNELFLWEQEQQQLSINQDINSKQPKQKQENRDKLPRQPQQNDKKQKNKNKLGKHVVFAPEIEIRNPVVVDYPSSSESDDDDETLVLVPVSGGGYGDASLPEVTAEESAGDNVDVSVPEEVDPGAVETASEVSEDELLGISEAEPEELIEISDGEQSVESEFESGRESASQEELSDHENSTDEQSSEDESSSDSGTPPRRSLRERRAPDRYSP